MYFNHKKLCKNLRQYQRIIIYGTGDYARQIYHQLIEYGLKERIVCFTQTKIGEEKTLYGIPVIPISREVVSTEESVILLAVSKLYTDEIKTKLLNEGYHNIVFLVDYEISYLQYCRMNDEELRYLTTFEEHCDAIADWYIKNHVCTESKDIVVQKLLDRGKEAGKKTEGNLIVIVCGLITERTIRIIGALKRKEHKIVILSYFGNVFPWYCDELQKVDVFVYQCQSVEEMLYMALQYFPLVYYFIPRWGDCLWAEIMMTNKQYFGKIVLELYDVLNDGYIIDEEDKLLTERYALEHADGIVWRWFSKEYLEKKGFQFQGKSIQFLDYCSPYIENRNIDVEEPTMIQLCLVTGFGVEYFRERYTTLYVEWAGIEEILDKIGNREDCSFHFYPGALDSESIERCKEYESKYKNFKYFLATEHHELEKRLENYDFGCDLATGGEEPDDDVPIGNRYGSTYKNGVRNTYFEYIRAGLPVITTFSSKLWEYLSEYDIVIPMNLENLDIDYLKKNRQYYKEKVKSARKELVIDKHIDKLIQLFSEV